MAKNPPPTYAWLVLGAAVIAVSSAGAVFQMMGDEVGWLLRASWRLQATSLILLPMAIIQYRAMDAESKSRLTSRNTLLILLGSGLCLGLHFGSWVWSLGQTSLTHSLLFVTAHPLVFVVGLWLIQRPTNREQTMGAIIGFIGAAIVLMGVESEGEVTFVGDAAAFLGAIAIVGYLVAGRHLRSWVPLFVYAFPVTMISALVTAGSAMYLEGASFASLLPEDDILGWTSLVWLPYIAYLALGPGLIGHTGINSVLKWLPPIVISVAVVMEPLLGSFIGWLLGTTGAPGIWTWLGGPLLIAGTLLVTLGETKRVADEEG